MVIYGSFQHFGKSARASVHYLSVLRNFRGPGSNQKARFSCLDFFSPFSLSLLSSYNIKHNPSYSLWLSSFSSEFQWQVLEGKLEERGKFSITYPLACRGRSRMAAVGFRRKNLGRYIHIYMDHHHYHHEHLHMQNAIWNLF